MYCESIYTSSEVVFKLGGCFYFHFSTLDIPFYNSYFLAFTRQYPTTVRLPVPSSNSTFLKMVMSNKNALIVIMSFCILIVFCIHIANYLYFLKYSLPVNSTDILTSFFILKILFLAVLGPYCCSGFL